MPFMDVSQISGKKRKPSSNSEAHKTKKAKESLINGNIDIESLEQEISQSRKHYNNIVTLLGLAFSKNEPATCTDPSAAVALCRIFCRLLADGGLRQTDALKPAEVTIVKWLEDKYARYITLLIAALAKNDQSLSAASIVSLIMQLVKNEVQGISTANWKSGVFQELLRTVVTSSAEDNDISEIFIQKYFAKYDDVRFHTLDILPTLLSEQVERDPSEKRSSSRVLEILLALPAPPSSDEELVTFLVDVNSHGKNSPQSAKANRKVGQKAWLAVFRSGLQKDQRRQILSLFTYQVVPWFSRPETLMDFLTDSYDEGGEMTLLALSGLFHLMQERNLDYPSFYQKLYSLLDQDLLQSKHRSRFFRLLNTFMSSTHLPAIMVASFVKRLCRLALFAPPSGAVVVIPWVYNMFKAHPTTSFMMHRVARCEEESIEWETYGTEDPFDMEELDPMSTKAMDSCVWELVTLQSHYHPNVATLAKIISEQFTKQSYNLEDFLDYSYKSLLEVELERELKKTPVVEYVIPKSIMLNDQNGIMLSSLFENAIKAQP